MTTHDTAVTSTGHSPREEAALDFVVQDPWITNDQLADLLYMSSRGVQALLRRLRDQGWLHVQGKGRARKLRVEQLTECAVHPETSVSPGNHQSTTIQNKP